MNKNGESPSSVTKNDTIRRLLRGEDVPDAPSGLSAAGGTGNGTGTGTGGQGKVSSVFSFSSTAVYGPAPKATKTPPSKYNMVILLVI